MQYLQVTDDEDQRRQYVVDNLDLVFYEGAIEGLVQFGIELDEEDRQKLRSLDDNLDRDFVIIASGEQPASVLFSVVLLGTGVLILLAVALLGRPRARE